MSRQCWRLSVDSCGRVLLRTFCRQPTVVPARPCSHEHRRVARLRLGGWRPRVARNRHATRARAGASTLSRRRWPPRRPLGDGGRRRPRHGGGRYSLTSDLPERPAVIADLAEGGGRGTPVSGPRRMASQKAQRSVPEVVAPMPASRGDGDRRAWPGVAAAQVHRRRSAVVLTMLNAGSPE